MLRARTLASLAAAAATLTFAAPAAAGGLTQLEGLDGCLSRDGSDLSAPGVCNTAGSLGEPRGMAMSPDGRNVYAANQATSTISVLARDPETGALAPLPGLDGCVSHDGTNQYDSVVRCRDVRAVSNARHVAVSPDGEHVYVTAGAGNPGTGINAVAVFSRDQSTGALTQLPGGAGCITASPTSANGCAGLPANVYLTEAYDLTVSPDGHQLYVSIFTHNSRIYAFDRGEEGALSFSSCVAALPPSSGESPPCTRAHALPGVRSLAVSPDGRSLYAAGGGYFGSPEWGVAVLSRAADGSLRQAEGPAGCITVNGEHHRIAGFCAVGRGLDNPDDVTVSPDGTTVYAHAYRGVVSFSRAGDGTLTQLDGEAGCLTWNGPESCAELSAPFQGSFRTVAVAPDGEEVFATGGSAVFSLERDRATGKLSQPSGVLGCIDQHARYGCADGRAMHLPYEVLVSPDGRHVYSSDFGQAAVAAMERGFPPDCEEVTRSVPYQTQVAIPLSCTDPNGDELTLRIVAGPSHGTLGEIDQAAGTVAYRPANGYRGPDAFTFAARDGAFESKPAKVAITVEPRPSLLGPICRAVLGGDQPLCDALP